MGDLVSVRWCEERDFPAYIIDVRSDVRVRVHYDGYGNLWDQDVGIEQIQGRLERVSSPAPPPCKRVAAAMGLRVKGDEPIAAYQVGDKLKISWRGSNYQATVLKIVSREKYLVHYDGHESEWDEVISLDRIVDGKR